MKQKKPSTIKKFTQATVNKLLRLGLLKEGEYCLTKHYFFVKNFKNEARRKKFHNWMFNNGYPIVVRNFIYNDEEEASVVFVNHPVLTHSSWATGDKDGDRDINHCDDPDARKILAPGVRKKILIDRQELLSILDLLDDYTADIDMIMYDAKQNQLLSGDGMRDPDYLDSQEYYKKLKQKVGRYRNRLKEDLKE